MWVDLPYCGDLESAPFFCAEISVQKATNSDAGSPLVTAHGTVQTQPAPKNSGVEASQPCCTEHTVKTEHNCCTVGHAYYNRRFGFGMSSGQKRLDGNVCKYFRDSGDKAIRKAVAKLRWEVAQDVIGARGKVSVPGNLHKINC